MYDNHQRKDPLVNSFPLEVYFSKIRVVPIEFLVGTIIHDKRTDERSFSINPNHIGFKSAEEQEAYYTALNSFIKQCGIIVYEDYEEDKELFGHLFETQEIFPDMRKDEDAYRAFWRNYVMECRKSNKNK